MMDRRSVLTWLSAGGALVLLAGTPLPGAAQEAALDASEDATIAGPPADVDSQAGGTDDVHTEQPGRRGCHVFRSVDSRTVERLRGDDQVNIVRLNQTVVAEGSDGPGTGCNATNVLSVVQTNE